MGFYQKLIRDHDKAKFRFSIIYCQEAHASDEWPIGSKYQIKQHRTLSDRIEAANILIRDFDYHNEILIDNLDNEFQDQYASWPTRFYLIKDKKIEYICRPDKATFSFDGILQRMKELET
jgi:hypothetical protein